MTRVDHKPAGFTHPIEAIKSNRNAWIWVVIGSIVTLILVIGSMTLLYRTENWYRGILVVVLVCYFPLAYVSYLQFRAKAHRERVEVDFQLLGLEAKDLTGIYNQIYSPQQFVIYITLTIMTVLLSLTHLRFPTALTAAFIDTEQMIRVVFYSFLGAYIFSLYYIYRRYVTLDLQPNVYLYITVRMVTVQVVAFIIAPQLYQLTQGLPALVPIVAFVIGYIPDTGIRWLTVMASQVIETLRRRDEQRLSVIDGISLWHETRLRESGIDNVQNLAAVDVRDILLHSRFNAQQLMHWVDQALLRTYLPDKKYEILCEHGITTISALRLFLEKVDASDTLTLPTFAGVPEEDLRAVYVATETAPNIGYVMYYWQAVQTYRAEVVNYRVGDLLKQFQKQIADVATDPNEAPAEHIGQFMQAFDLDAKQAEAMVEDSPHSLVGLGRIHIQHQDYEAARQVLDKAISLDPQNAEAYSTRGWGHFVQKAYDQALADFERALAFNPQDPITFNRKGTAHLWLGYHQKALDAYSQAITLKPDYVSAYYNRGHVRQMLADFDQALADFGQTLTYDPTCLQAYLRRAAILIAQGDFREAIRDCDRAIQADRNNPVCYNQRAVAYMKLNDYQRALYDLETALDIDPNSPIFFLNRAEARRHLNDLEGAGADCTQALRLKPDLPSAYELRAFIYAQQGRLAGAITDFEHYLDLTSANQAQIETHIATLKAALAEKRAGGDGREVV